MKDIRQSNLTYLMPKRTILRQLCTASLNTSTAAKVIACTKKSSLITTKFTAWKILFHDEYSTQHQQTFVVNGGL